MSATALLDRLAHVKQTAPGRWLARCPAHEDRSPSLSIRELEDGRVLLHDFGGCGTEAVLDSLGLEMQALFPERLPQTRAGVGYSPSHSRIPARDLLEALSLETGVVLVITQEILAQRRVSESDWQRLATAARRIHAARDLAYGC